MKSLELKVPPVAVVGIVAALMWLAASQFHQAAFRVPWRYPLVSLLAGVGILIGAAGMTAFHRARTTVNPMQPEAAASLVTAGIFRYSRNPMYLGLLALLVAWAVFLENLLALVLSPAFVAYMTRFQIAPEERALKELFGAQFDSYTRLVRRWL